MEKIDKLMNLLEKKYGNKTITDGSKEKIRGGIIMSEVCEYRGADY